MKETLLPQTLKVIAQPSPLLQELDSYTEALPWQHTSFKISVYMLRKLRSKNMTQKSLAEKMGVSPQLVSRWLKGRENFTLETLTKIEAALETSLIQCSFTEFIDHETTNDAQYSAPEEDPLFHSTKVVDVEASLTIEQQTLLSYKEILDHTYTELQEEKKKSEEKDQTIFKLIRSLKKFQLSSDTIQNLTGLPLEFIETL